MLKVPVENWKKFLSMHSSLLALSPDAVIWGGFSKDLGFFNMILSFAASIVVMAVFLALLIGIVVPLGQLVGFYLDLSGNAVRAYSVNFVGSVAGLWTLAVLSFLWLPPGYWFGFIVFANSDHPTFAASCINWIGIAWHQPCVFARRTHGQGAMLQNVIILVFTALASLFLCWRSRFKICRRCRSRIRLRVREEIFRPVSGAD
jgi:hypothetical protein